MATVLTILKIAGIVAACILGLALFIIFLVLHVPVYYRAEILVNETDACVKYRFSWLVNLLWISGVHGNRGHTYKIRILGIPVKSYYSMKAVEGEQLSDRLRERIRHRFTGAGLDSLKRLWELLQKYDSNNRAYRHILSEVLWLLKKYKPRKILGYLDFGFEDPAVTGMVLGLYYAVYPVSPEAFQVTGNFEGSSLDGDLTIKGRMHVRQLLAMYRRLFRDREVVKLFRNREKKHGRKQV